MQEFEFDIYHRPETQHAVADFLTRLESGEAGDGVIDEFPDPELFMGTTEPTTDSTVAEKDKWLTDMHQFLSTGLPTNKMDQDERKRLVVQSRDFCLIQDTPYNQQTDGIWRRTM